MQILIKIQYESPAGRVEVSGSFPLRGRTAAQVALDWWEQDISRGYNRRPLAFIVDGQDITNEVKNLKWQLKKSTEHDDLPF